MARLLESQAANGARADPIALDRVPLLVGVTGHRDIAPEDEAPLRVAFGGVLRDLAAKYASTQLVVISGLAPGADILAAEEAFAQGVPVIAALPMPVGKYEEDFPAEADKARFRLALAACARVITVAEPAERRSGYVATGRFLTHYSHVLVAFWDGLPGRGDGGTADVVRIRTTGEIAHLTDVQDIPYLPDTGPVYHVRTPHREAPRLAGAYGLNRIYPKRFGSDSFAERDFTAALKHLDRYNKDLAARPRRAAMREAAPVALRQATDAAAERLQRATNYYQYAVLIFGATAAGLPSNLFSPLLKVIALAIAFALFGIARLFDYQNRYQDYRTIAEALRVQEAWHCSGLRYEWVDASYLGMQQSELQWIRMALRGAYLLFYEGDDAAASTQSLSACQEWVESQWTYYRARSRSLRKAHRLINQVSYSLLAASGSVAAVSAIVAAWRQPRPVWIQIGHPWDLAVEYSATVLVLVTFLWHLVAQREYTANARRYQRMFIIFDRAKTRLQRLSGGLTPESRFVIRELGREALIEHADWLLRRRDRPISIEL